MLVATLCGCASDSLLKPPVVHTTSSEEDHGLALLPSSFHRVHAMEVKWDDEQSQRMHYGWHRLTLYDSNMKEIAYSHFSCHYGMDVDAVDLDGDRTPEFVVSLHIGPATGPNIRELKILRLRDEFLEEILSIPQAGQAGPNQGWWYDVEYSMTHDGQVAVRMVRDHNPLGEWVSFLPATREYRISVRTSGVLVNADADVVEEKETPKQDVQATR